MCFLGMMVWASISARRLEFYPKMNLDAVTARVRRRLHKGKGRQRDPADPRSHTSSASKLALQSAGLSLSSVFGREGLLGVDSVYFDDILAIRELFETGLHSYQAYRMTQLLPRLGLIRVYVVLLVMNCWYVPVLHSVYRDQHHKRRMASLLCDAVLDMLSSMGITLLIFDPAFGFSFVNWFNDSGSLRCTRSSSLELESR